MKKSVYTNIILLGSEKGTADILGELVTLRQEWGYRLSYYGYGANVPGTFEKLCREKGVDFIPFGTEKNRLTESFLECSARILVFSVRNTYLFPKAVVEKPNIDILNCHSALLPKYPGRNAPSWAIFCGESVSGPTWHWVNAGVDTGSILWQGECPIGEDTRAYELIRSLEEKALEGFREIIGEVLKGTAKAIPQPSSGDRRIYLSKEAPANGHFSLSDDPQKIYRLLRCMDYGPNHVFPRPRTEIDEIGSVEITGYKKVKEGEYSSEGKRRFRLPLGNGFDLILKYRKAFSGNPCKKNT